MAGLERIDAGEIHIDGRDITRLRGRALLPYSNRIQVIFQDSAAALNPRFTALQIISEPMVIQGHGGAVERRRRAADLMAQAGLPVDRLGARPGEFSGGERQRLALARALAVNPDVLVLDEAFSGLDAAACDRILRLLADLQAAHGITCICISHDLDLLASFCSEIALMQDGRIVERGPAHAARRAGYEPDGRARELLAPAGAVA